MKRIFLALLLLMISKTALAQEHKIRFNKKLGYEIKEKQQKITPKITLLSGKNEDFLILMFPSGGKSLAFRRRL